MSGLILDEVFENVGEVAEDIRSATFNRGQTVHLHMKVESGGPFELLILGPNEEIIKTLGGISGEYEYDYSIPTNGTYSFSFQSTGTLGTIRLKVSLKP